MKQYHSRYKEKQMLRYVHTNIIAKDFQKLVDFYKEVFQGKSIGETRDLRGELQRWS